jgi:hypothetical protein
MPQGRAPMFPHLYDARLGKTLRCDLALPDGIGCFAGRT